MRAAPLALLFLAGACARRPAVDRALERMTDQPRADRYTASGVFPDGSASQAPPGGTVARGDSAGDDGPPDVTPALLSRGRDRFGIYCAVCHGAAGDGASVVASNMTEHRPPPLRSAAVTRRSGRELYEIVRRGTGWMPGYAAQLSVADRWAVVAYVQALARERAR